MSNIDHRPQRKAPSGMAFQPGQAELGLKAKK
jgi:hypothetical protein